jgi:DNA-binding transcriptional ArsR family regulator
MGEETLIPSEELRRQLAYKPNGIASSYLYRYRGDKKGRFLRGPIPMTWLEQAGKLPGSALQLGIQIWFLTGMKGKDATPAVLNLSKQVAFGLTQPTASRALQALKRAGLVEVELKPGRAPRVRPIVPKEEPE